MRKVISFITTVLILSIPGYALNPVAQGNTNYELGAFVVEKSIRPIIVDARILPTYEVSYENSGMTIRIAVDNTNRKCKKYIVVSDDLTIQYNCNGKIFGAVIVEDEYADDRISTSRINLNRIEYFHQKVITCLPVNEIESIKLISVYFPKLIKDYDRVFAIK